MSKRIEIGLIAVIIAIFAASCGRVNSNDKLAAAETIMEEHPDSALAILKKIDKRDLDQNELPLYALLMSQAMDKNYIDTDNDSLISIAYNYYLSGDDERRKMLACHYNAVVNLNARNYGVALASALRAEQIALESGDTISSARSEAVISLIFSHSNNYRSAITYQKLSLEKSKKLGKKSWIRNDYSFIVNYYINTKQFDSARIYLDSVRIWSADEDREMREQGFLIATGQNLNTEADSIFSSMMNHNDNPDARIYAHTALANLRMGDMMRYDSLMAKSKMLMRKWTDSVDISGVRERIALENGNYREAYENSLYGRGETSKIFFELANNSIYLVQIEHEKRTSAANELKSRLYKDRYMRTGAVLVLAVLLAIMTALYARMSGKRRKAEAEKEMLALWSEYIEEKNMAENNRRELKESRASLERLNRATETLSRDNEALRREKLRLTERISELSRPNDDDIADRYGWIEKLASIYSHSSNMVSKKEKTAYSRIEDEITRARSRDFVSEMTAEINSRNNNLLKRIDDTSGPLSEQDMTLMTYMCMGLSIHTIAFLMGKSDRTIYNRKSMLKGKIAENSAEITEMLSKLVRKW